MGKVEEFEVYTKSRKLIKHIYEMTSKGKFRYDRALVDQMRRSSVSIISNIAEGYERNSNKEFSKFLSYSKGSCGELKVQIVVAHDIGYITEEEKCGLVQDCEDMLKMPGGFKKYLTQTSR